MNQLIEHEEIVDELGDSEDVLQIDTYAITSYGADFDVEGWVRRLQKGSIVIPTFQRGYVWKFKTACRLIESILLGLPIPSVFLSVEPNNTYLVIDGQQRLRTLRYFFEGRFPTAFDSTGRETSWQPFKLDFVQEEFKGIDYDALSSPFRLKLENTVIHATIVQQNEPEDDNSSIYLIFDRLNSGSVPLSAQEIRASVYHGPFNELLYELNTTPSWRTLFGNPNTRLRDQELILRFLALYYSRNEYEEPFKLFLNKFMSKHRYLNTAASVYFHDLFIYTMDTIVDCIGSKAFRPTRQLNAAVMDSVSVGVALAIENGTLDCKNLEVQYKALLENDGYSDAVKRSTANVERVRTRLDLAIQAFAGE